MRSMTVSTERARWNHRTWLTATASAVLALTACGGDDDGAAADAFAPPVVVANASAACAALTGKSIAAADIGEPSTGAVVTAATYKPAVADAPNAANTATVPGTPDYCQTLIDIKPVDPAA